MAEVLKLNLRRALDEKDPRARHLFALAMGRDFKKNRFPGQWRMTVWKPYTNRSEKPKPTPLDPKFNKIASWNINGFASKRYCVEGFLGKYKVAVLCLQETLQTSAFAPMRVKGYTTFEISRETGFRGQAILVRRELSAYRIPHVEKQILHVKINRYEVKEGFFPLHVFSIYLPSGGNRVRERKILYQTLSEITAKILKNDSNSRIVLVGDWNDERNTVSSRFADSKHLNMLNAKGSPLTRFPREGPKRSLDSFVLGGGWNGGIAKSRVMRSWAASDHRPIIAKIKGSMPLKVSSREYIRWDLQRLREQRPKFVSHNRWALLDVEYADLDDQTEQYNIQADAILRQIGVKKTVTEESHRPKLPRALAKVLKEWKSLVKRADTTDETKRVEAQEKADCAKTRFLKMSKQWRTRQEKLGYKRVIEDMLSGDLKSAWNRVSGQTHMGTGTATSLPISPGQPLRNKQGDLVTSIDEKVGVLREHYRELHQDTRTDSYNKRRFWEVNVPGLDKSEDRSDEGNEGCSDLVWPEVLVAIREMNTDTSPGKDELHINMFKAMVREESMAQLKKLLPRRTRWENIQVDLPVAQLPATPLTRMGKATWDLLERVWREEKFPKQWEENVIFSLFKGGDPELPNNYRGITLISVLQKILCGVLMQRLNSYMDKNDLFDSNQGGFRPGEEAMAQFLALAEIVRRRWNVDGPGIASNPTMVAFIDLKKAYDKVPLELVLCCMRNYGFSPKYIRLIRQMYLQTKVSVKIGDFISDFYDLLRGLRQGCLLSPILFIILVTNVMEYVRREMARTTYTTSETGGVGTPYKDTSAHSVGTVYGLLYADDMAGMEDSVRTMKDFLLKLESWCRMWWMELGVNKCGVMLWTKDPETISEYQSTTFNLQNGTIPKVDSYKYLGITVDKSLPYSRAQVVGERTNESTYVAQLAQKGLNTLHQLRPVLIDRKAPMILKTMLIKTFLIPKMMYGGEWLGFRQLNSLPLQRVVNIAAHWCVGLKGNSNITDSQTLCTELGIPTIEEIFARARTRIYLKFRDKGKETRESTTWLARLCNTEKRYGRQETWVFTSRKQLSEILFERDKYFRRKIDKDREILTYIDDGARLRDIDSPEPTATMDAPLRWWDQYASTVAADVRSGSFKSDYLESIRLALGNRLPDLEGYFDLELPYNLQREQAGQDSGYDQALERFMEMSQVGLRKGNALHGNPRMVRLVGDCVRERSFDANKSVTFIWYDQFAIGATRGFYRRAMRRHDLVEGVRLLALARVRAFPSVRLHRIRQRFKDIMIPDDQLDICPICQKHITPNWDWAHLLIECTASFVVDSREENLQVHIDEIYGEFKRDDMLDTISAFNDSDLQGKSIRKARRLACAVYLIGGTVGVRTADGSPNVAYTEGFGPSGAMLSYAPTHGWVHVAKFLQEIYPRFSEALSMGSGDDLVNDMVEL